MVPVLRPKQKLYFVKTDSYNFEGKKQIGAFRLLYYK